MIDKLYFQKNERIRDFDRKHVCIQPTFQSFQFLESTYCCLCQKPLLKARFHPYFGTETSSAPRLYSDGHSVSTVNNVRGVSAGNIVRVSTVDNVRVSTVVTDTAK